MLTTYRTLLDLLDRDVNRADREDEYPAWIDQAMREIQKDNAWCRLRTTREVQIPSGQSAVSLPSDFNQFTRERDPVRVQGSNGTHYPCRLMTEEEVISLKAASIYPVTSTSVLGSNIGLPVFLTYDTDTYPVLNVFVTATSDLDFIVSYYRYLPELQEDTDSNFFLQDYPEMVKSKLKAVAFTEVNDPLGPDYEKLYRTVHLPSAMIDDDRKWRAGRPRRMGGGR